MNIPQEKQIIIDFIRAKHNVCITGAAGTGKSFMLRLIREHFPHVHVTASTGVAAVNVGGVTIHSWSGIGNGSHSAEEIVRFINSGPGTKIRRNLKKARLLAIDEISMVSANTLELINLVLQKVRCNEQSFGGIQLLVLGDFFQLPPVSKSQIPEYCFDSMAWKDANFRIFELSEIFRQSDLRFIQLLNNIRYAALNEEDISLLKQRQEAKLDSHITPTILVTHNAQAEQINIARLNQLNESNLVSFQMTESGKESAVSFLKKNCLASSQLNLKIGAQVMMLKNTLQKQGIINGSIGIITNFNKEKNPIVRFFNGVETIISPEVWAVETYNETIGKTEVTGSIKQIPLILAWAITIHKSQGMTMDSVLCDLTNVFADGQVYVALSRVKSLDGLFLRGFKTSSLKVNEKVKKFYQQIYSDNNIIN